MAYFAGPKPPCLLSEKPFSISCLLESNSGNQADHSSMTLDIDLEIGNGRNQRGEREVNRARPCSQEPDRPTSANLKMQNGPLSLYERNYPRIQVARLFEIISARAPAKEFLIWLRSKGWANC
jgi:hypothetical protein